MMGLEGLPPTARNPMEPLLSPPTKLRKKMKGGGGWRMKKRRRVPPGLNSASATHI